MFPLLTNTHLDWVQVVLESFPEFLQDHAQCEQKAMATAMSLLSRFSGKEALVEPMICLAKEELAHFHEVYRLMRKRGIELSKKTEDPYAKALSAHIRHGEEDYFLDKLLVCSLIEARSAERFELLSQHLSEEPWKGFYRSLAQSEKGHWRVFYRIAYHYYGQEASRRLDELAKCESECLASTPVRACVH